MDEKKKSIIVNEIHFWKQNQMLPEHYCDFLLALYEQGESTSEPKIVKSSLLKKRPSYLIVWQTGLVVATILALLMIFMLDSFLVPVMFILLLAVVLILSMNYFSKRSLQVPIMYVLLALLLLGFSLKIWLVFLPDNPMILAWIMIVNCVLWIIAGKALKLVYFLISGIAGILVIVYYLFF